MYYSIGQISAESIVYTVQCTMQGTLNSYKSGTCHLYMCQLRKLIVTPTIRQSRTIRGIGTLYKLLAY